VKNDPVKEPNLDPKFDEHRQQGCGEEKKWGGAREIFWT
jgi:hypothetical protein